MHTSVCMYAAHLVKGLKSFKQKHAALHRTISSFLIRTYVLFKQVDAGLEMPHIAMDRVDLLEMAAIIGKEYNNQSHYTPCLNRSTK